MDGWAVKLTSQILQFEGVVPGSLSYWDPQAQQMGRLRSFISRCWDRLDGRLGEGMRMRYVKAVGLEHDGMMSSSVSIRLGTCGTYMKVLERLRRAGSIDAHAKYQYYHTH